MAIGAVTSRKGIDERVAFGSCDDERIDPAVRDLVKSLLDLGQPRAEGFDFLAVFFGE
jgi:hypothetical protein